MARLPVHGSGASCVGRRSVCGDSTALGRPVLNLYRICQQPPGPGGVLEMSRYVRSDRASTPAARARHPGHGHELGQE